MIFIFGILAFLAYYFMKYMVIGAMICYSYYKDWKDKKWCERYKKEHEFTK